MKRFAIVVALAVMGFFCLAGAGTPAAWKPNPNFKPPQMVVWGAHGTTSVTYISFTAMFASLQDITRVQFRGIPGSTEVDRVKLLTQNKASFVGFSAPDIIWPMLSIQSFAGQKPVSMRVVWLRAPSAKAYGVQADSNIKTMFDLKGKKVSSTPDYATTQEQMECGLAYANLTWKDVVEVKTGSFAASLEAVIRGSSDVGCFTVFAAQSYDLEGSSHGLRWLPMPASDVDAWARLQKVAPYLTPYNLTSGPGGGTKDKPIPVMQFTGCLATLESMDKDLVYWMTKQVHQNYDKYKGKHSALAEMSVDNTLDTDYWTAPFHEGSVQYLKDVGLWTTKHEKAQQALLAKYKMI